MSKFRSGLTSIGIRAALAATTLTALAAVAGHIVWGD
jgi:hypothetical protein